MHNKAAHRDNGKTNLCAALSQGLLKLVHKHLPRAEIEMDVAEGATLVWVTTEVFLRVEVMRATRQMAPALA